MSLGGIFLANIAHRMFSSDLSSQGRILINKRHFILLCAFYKGLQPLGTFSSILPLEGRILTIILIRKILQSWLVVE